MSDRRNDPTAFVFINEVSIIEHLSRTAAERVLPEGLSLAGFTVLNHMIRLGHERRAPAQIAGAVQVTKGAMTGTLKRLEAEGWISVTADPDDGRGKVVMLTPEGRAIRETALSVLALQLELVLRAVSEDELRQAIPVLQKVRAALDAARD
ncbi:MarR family winged helix-turn-helix transcriptional regulator [Phenylobacterium sp.]|uniref:MarR family winged helix-turn-helix transcriptional regulator n=1 Tax=Phenylobacterium sp. TaxID=1871053 RepID=UPI0037C6F496